MEAQEVKVLTRSLISSHGRIQTQVHLAPKPGCTHNELYGSLNSWAKGRRPVPSPIPSPLQRGSVPAEPPKPRAASTTWREWLGIPQGLLSAPSPGHLKGGPSMADGGGQGRELREAQTSPAVSAVSPYLNGHYWSGQTAHGQTRYSLGTQGARGWHRTGGCHCADLSGTAAGPHTMGTSQTSSSPHQDLQGEIQAQGFVSFPHKCFSHLLILCSIQLLLFSSFLNLQWYIL